ncbi:hypothetical protein CONPUDRAFT_74392 [Coniophora puteana RWD-64-598 SS2]|uniref:Uncharacterized protein n=1 Tax=Coniophora puteana (strain RWD-64-598) TaxID=741705 RepID=A0A5M3MHT1_CONPW|nr:uncharacterized protein CONPUDRAFT_74392 [Coniophora puteana RWD-64-598 SS2]EIW78789.1 hypothetical protein CONPUDRAFT_74392 [Coniophora puteana RWD-64-598 SS2]
MSSASLEQVLVADANLSMQTGYAAVAMLSLVTYDYRREPSFRERSVLRFDLEILGNRTVLIEQENDIYYRSVHALTKMFLRRFPLFSTTQIACIIINIILQGMLSVRIYVLFGRSAAVLLALGSCFVIAQLLKIGFNSWFLSSGPTSLYEFGFLSINFCVQDVPVNRVWTYLADGTTMLVFEIILCAFALRYAFKSLEDPFWKSPTRSVVSLGSVIVRDNLVYFFIALVNTVLIAVYDSPNVVISVAYSCISLICLTILWALVGPWMIISLRKSYNRDIEEVTPNEHELTTVAFVTPATPVESYVEV